jgi:hypothetical protein
MAKGREGCGLTLSETCAENQHAKQNCAESLLCAPFDVYLLDCTADSGDSATRYYKVMIRILLHDQYG